MRAFLGELDRVTLLVLVIGLVAGGLWLVSLPLGIIVSAVLAPVGAIVLLVARRWLEIGVLSAAIGLVPTVAYRVVGPPSLPVPLPRDITPPEIIAPGAAYLFLVAGMLLIAATAFFGVRHGRRRDHQGREHAARRDARMDGRAP